MQNEQTLRQFAYNDTFFPCKQSQHKQASTQTMDQTWIPNRIVWVGDEAGLAQKNDPTLLGSMVTVGTDDLDHNQQTPNCVRDGRRDQILSQAGSRWGFTGSAHRELHQSLVIASEMGRIVGCQAETPLYTDFKVDGLKALLRARGIGLGGKKRKQDFIDRLVSNDTVAASELPPVAYWTWARLVACLAGTPPTTDTIEDRTLFTFCWSKEPNMIAVHDIYEKIAAVPGVRTRCYPDFADVHESERKIGDIAALDEIARTTLWPPYKYRPQTCYEQDNCQLQEPFVIKRTHSSGGETVDLDPSAGRTAGLRCRGGDGALPQPTASPARRARSATPPPDLSADTLTYGETVAPIWFHQETVNSLVDYGEFKLVIGTLPDASGLRGCTGAVLEAFHTKPRTNKPTEPTVSVMSRVPGAFLRREHCGMRTYQDLEDFALFVFEQLRRYGQPEAESTTSSSSSGHDEGDQHSGDDEDDDDDQVPSSSSSSKRSSEDPEDSGRASKSPRLSESTDDADVADNDVHEGDDDDDDDQDSEPANTSSPLASSPPASSPPASSPPATPEIPADNSQEPDYRRSMFQSLEVGVRLDIGISSEADGHRFFVNEITREWYGDLISYKTGEPRTRICVGLAEARARFLFGVGQVETAVGDDDSSSQSSTNVTADPVAIAETSETEHEVEVE